jgi:hypothetical protein
MEPPFDNAPGMVAFLWYIIRSMRTTDPGNAKLKKVLAWVHSWNGSPSVDEIYAHLCTLSKSYNGSLTKFFNGACRIMEEKTGGKMMLLSEMVQMTIM